MTPGPRTVVILVSALAASAFGAFGASAQGAQPIELGTYNAWNAYSAPAKSGKVCYALAQPKTRKPSGLARDPAYFFVSNRPKDNVRNEVSVILGFPMKPDSDVELRVGGAEFNLYVRADGAFVRSAEEETKLVQALRKGGRDMTVKATSLRGRVTTDSYPLAGIAQALERIDKDCR